MKTCNPENMTADAEAAGDVYKDDQGVYIAGMFRTPVMNSIYCHDCGTDLPCSIDEVDDVVNAHLSE